MLEALGQGSWLTDGSVPPYVPRAADRMLERALTPPSLSPGRLVVVAGPPRSGKTRIVAENVVLPHRSSTIWWLHPTWRILDRTHRALEPIGRLPAALTVVIDDVNRCEPRTRPGAADAAIHRLIDAGAIVIVIRSAQRRPHRDHPLGSLGRIISRPPDARLWIPSALTASERRAIPADLCEQAARHQLSVTRLAEALTGGTVLRARWRHAQVDHHHPYRCALVTALERAVRPRLDQPITGETLIELTRQVFRSVAPTRLWSPEGYRDALAWALEPVGGPPPSAILTRHPDGRLEPSALLRSHGTIGPGTGD